MRLPRWALGGLAVTALAVACSRTTPPPPEGTTFMHRGYAKGERWEETRETKLELATVVETQSTTRAFEILEVDAEGVATNVKVTSIAERASGEGARLFLADGGTPVGRRTVSWAIPRGDIARGRTVPALADELASLLTEGTAMRTVSASAQYYGDRRENGVFTLVVRLEQGDPSRLMTLDLKGEAVIAIGTGRLVSLAMEGPVDGTGRMTIKIANRPIEASK